jgi:hypothetical protein
VKRHCGDRICIAFSRQGSAIRYSAACRDLVEAFNSSLPTQYDERGSTRMEGVVHVAPQVPFNVVDEIVYLLDTDAEPWSIQLEVRVAGTLVEDRLRTALSEALDRHPMARARKAPTGLRSEHQYCWEITAKAALDPLRVVDCPDSLSPAGCMSSSATGIRSSAERPPLALQIDM